jgi:RNA polymerase-binding transcription factor DksA
MKHPDGRPWNEKEEEKAPEMSPQEAIEVLKGFITNLTAYSDISENSEPVRTHRAAIKALEKQIPLKPIRQSFRSFGRCTACDNNITTHKDYNHCGKCGQAIDWSVL